MVGGIAVGVRTLHSLCDTVSEEVVGIILDVMQRYSSGVSSELFRLSAARSRRLSARLREARTHCEAVGPFTNFDHHDGWLHSNQWLGKTDEQNIRESMSHEALRQRC